MNCVAAAGREPTGAIQSGSTSESVILRHLGSTSSPLICKIPAVGTINTARNFVKMLSEVLCRQPSSPPHGDSQ